MARTPRLRHLRHSHYARQDRSKHLDAFLAERVDTLEGTGATKTFTATTLTKATGTLTMAGLVVDGEQQALVNINGREYRFVNEISVDAVAAAATGGFEIEDVPEDGDTVTLGDITYTFQTVLDNDDPYNVLIGVDVAACADALYRAINDDDDDEGTLYSTGTQVHPDVSAALNVGDVELTANVEGVAGNDITTTTTSEVISPFAATLEDGADETEATPDEILIGVSASACLDNLIAAINNEAGEGTTYTTGTVVNAHVTAAAGSGDTMVVSAIAGGVAPNAYEVSASDEDDYMSWGSATLTGGANVSLLASTAHGFDIGDGPFLLTSSGALPTGLAVDRQYWIKTKPDADSFSLSTVEGGAAAGYMSAGSGTHTITRSDTKAAIYEDIRENGSERVANATDVDNLA